MLLQITFNDTQNNFTLKLELIPLQQSLTTEVNITYFNQLIVILYQVNSASVKKYLQVELFPYYLLSSVFPNIFIF